MKQRNSLTSNSKQTGRRPADVLIDLLDIFHLTCVKPTTGLEDFERPFASVEMDKNCWLTLPRWKSLCHNLARDQPQPGSFFSFFSNDQGRQRRETLGTRLG